MHTDAIGGGLLQAWESGTGVKCGVQCAPSWVKVVYCVNAGTSSRTSPSSESIAALAVCVNRCVVAVGSAACCAAGAVLMCCRSSSRNFGSKPASRPDSLLNAVLYAI